MEEFEERERESIIEDILNRESVSYPHYVKLEHQEKIRNHFKDRCRKLYNECHSGEVTGKEINMGVLDTVHFLLIFSLENKFPSNWSYITLILMLRSKNCLQKVIEYWTAKKRRYVEDRKTEALEMWNAMTQNYDFEFITSLTNGSKRLIPSHEELCRKLDSVIAVILTELKKSHKQIKWFDASNVEEILVTLNQKYQHLVEVYNRTIVKCQEEAQEIATDCEDLLLRLNPGQSQDYQRVVDYIRQHANTRLERFVNKNKFLNVYTVVENTKTRMDEIFKHYTNQVSFQIDMSINEFVQSYSFQDDIEDLKKMLSTRFPDPSLGEQLEKKFQVLYFYITSARNLKKIKVDMNKQYEYLGSYFAKFIENNITKITEQFNVIGEQSSIAPKFLTPIRNRLTQLLDNSRKLIKKDEANKSQVQEKISKNLKKYITTKYKTLPAPPKDSEIQELFLEWTEDFYSRIISKKYFPSSDARKMAKEVFPESRLVKCFNNFIRRLDVECNFSADRGAEAEVSNIRNSDPDLMTVGQITVEEVADEIGGPQTDAPQEELDLEMPSSSSVSVPHFHPDTEANIGPPQPLNMDIDSNSYFSGTKKLNLTELQVSDPSKESADWQFIKGRTKDNFLAQTLRFRYRQIKTNIRSHDARQIFNRLERIPPPRKILEEYFSLHSIVTQIHNQISSNGNVNFILEATREVVFLIPIRLPKGN